MSPAGHRWGTTNCVKSYDNLYHGDPWSLKKFLMLYDIQWCTRTLLYHYSKLYIILTLLFSVIIPYRVWSPLEELQVYVPRVQPQCLHENKTTRSVKNIFIRWRILNTKTLDVTNAMYLNAQNMRYGFSVCINSYLAVIFSLFVYHWYHYLLHLWLWTSVCFIAA